uniref:Uncharacterized protein n=1 Tax=Onion yellows phytoplasma OY-W TaxID=428984 RepID=A6QKM0_ONYPH|nr:hypothetical protein [Onion yellows phytoplasma OY-W]
MIDSYFTKDQENLVEFLDVLWQIMVSFMLFLTSFEDSQSCYGSQSVLFKAIAKLLKSLKMLL